MQSPETGHHFARRLVLLTLLALTVYGAFIRSYSISKQSLWIDETVTVLQCKGIIACGLPKQGDGYVNWDAFPANYLYALGYLLSDNVNIAARIIPIVLGTACIPFVFLLLRKQTGSSACALMGAALVALLEEQVAWSRQARPYITVEFLTLVTLWCGINYNKAQRWFYLLLGVLASLAAAFSHRCGYIAVFTLVLTVVFDVRRSGIARLVGVTAVVFLAIVLIGYFAPSNSSLTTSLQSLVSSNYPNYLRNYGHYFEGAFGLLLLLAGVGITSIPVYGWRTDLALLIPSVCFFIILALRTMLYGHRYVFPLSICIIWFIAKGFLLTTRGLRLFFRRSIAIALAAIIVFALGYTARWAFFPKDSFDLGYTAPTPPWSRAYELIAQRFGSSSTNGVRLVTVSAFPAFHDIYLSAWPGEKYCIPVNYSGIKGDIWGPAFTTATVIDNMAMLTNISGYVVLDDFALRMIARDDIKAYFLSHKPNAILRSRYSVYLWILKDGRAVP
jgi:hypothetical protein